jgi:hypothetical protein
MKLSIEITSDELIQAAQNLIYTQSLDKDTEADEEAIALIIKQHLESVIEDILSNAEKYLKPEEWTQVNNCFTMNYFAYQKLMNQDIPYPL